MDSCSFQKVRYGPHTIKYDARMTGDLEEA